MSEYSGLRGVLALVLALLSMGVAAQDEGDEAPAEEGSAGNRVNGNDRRYYVSPMFSYTMADDDRLTDDAIGGAISLGKKMTAGLDLELTAFYEKMDAEDPAGDSAELTGYGVAALIFPSNTWPRLYGILALHDSKSDNHPTTPPQSGYSYDGQVFDSGLGYLLALKDWVGIDMDLRAEARYRMDSHHSRIAGVGGKDEFYEAVFNVGVIIPLGKGEEPPPAPAAPGDADADGVADDADQCPDTPAGTQVDEKGCPPPAKEGCRAPAPGQPIDLEGCATGEAVVLKGVNFEVNSSRLTANAKVILNQVADSLAAATAMRVEIGGHTDAQGSDSFNQKLSERRAQAVKDYLIARGIDAARLESKGYGESQPVDSNDTAEGRELNRRVEMKILEGGGS